MFGMSMKERPKRVTEVVTATKDAFTGDYRGRTVKITPAPFRPGGPRVILGGSSQPAARIADGSVPSMPSIWDHYRDEVMKLGRPDPGPCMVGETQVAALASDPEAG
ncbi:MAG TPA: hypothetical protein VF503_03800 [Sphingobium sp.]|uniref:hypothetical protein n=1 Tax=Sphingobium sp. TaxID=1912891 RepID=UPI002ED0B765